MERLELKALKRDVGKSLSRKLRREGSVPAILYGVGRDSSPLFVDAKELDKVLSTEAGWNILLDLNIDGKETVLARVSDYQAAVIRRNITHVDFQVLDLKKKMKTEVPIRLVGESKGVKEGGILELIRRQLEVRCFPTNIPEHIDIDITELDIGDNVHIKDLTMPEGVECIFETNFSIAAVVAPTVIVEEVPAEGALAEGVEGAEGAEGVEGAAEGAEGKEGKDGKAAAPAKDGKAAAPAEGGKKEK